ncbi:hypothetical protein B0G71_8235 [Paraburkholderia sp. BL27I4N3]|uniref:HNH endonuclease n=1 Tax=Paraburkholderia sp. BL27I4N3 TaxID=1938805 RepID=UPI000E260D5C|nr:hypothetical protein [Paraburkholderia sp. BL27I4N3]REE06556.1 hypothetical protein B0G71_8235 [Paraburkholderia sp. BL27I4N3]
MKITTAGEALFYLIRDEILDVTGTAHAKWINLTKFFEHVGGDVKYAHYVKGAVAIHSVRRLLRFWEEEKPLTGSEALYVAKVTGFIKLEVFPGLDSSLVGRLARAVIRAEAASFKPIKPKVKTRVLGERGQISCYLCARELDPSAAKDNAAHLTFEHLWPTSIGGDSVEENLLPACTRCQLVTKDTASWEWINLQNFVLPKEPSIEALKAVPHSVRFARHYLYVADQANRSEMSLKEAFLRVGPMSKKLGNLKTGLPVTFFDLTTTPE